MNWIPEPLTAFTAWLMRTTLQAGVLVLLIVAVQAVFRDRLTPRWRYALWIILLVRLVVPWAPESSLSVYNWARLPRTAASRHSPSPPPPPDETSAAETMGPVVPSPEEPEGPPRDASPLRARFTPSVPDILTMIWLGGSGLFLGTLLIQAIRYVGMGRRRPVTDQATLDLLEDCKEMMGVRTYLAVVETPQVAGPSLFGVIRPRLLLPPGTIARMGPERLRHIFLHELAHIKRNDVLANWLMAILQALHWFNPLVWLGFHRMRVEQELACDALALSRIGAREAGEYGETVVRLLEEFSRPRRLPGLVGVLEDRNQMLRRITMIASFKDKAYQGSRIATVAIAAVCLVALTNAKTGDGKTLSAAQAELMGRVEDFFLHNYQDITWLKSLEWSDFRELPDGNRTITYRYKARIWDRETQIVKDIFTFDPNGKLVGVRKADGYPRKEAPTAIDTKTKPGMQALVEEFFRGNYRDITARKTLEWGDVMKEANGNSSIRYKYEATIWHKDKIVNNQVFTFDATGRFVSVRNVEGFPQKIGPAAGRSDLSSPEATVKTFALAAATGDIRGALACIAIDSPDYHDTTKILDRPADARTNPMRVLLEATDTGAPITITKKDVSGDTCSIVWRVRLKGKVNLKGTTLEPGSTFDWDARLKKVKDHWLIVGI